jgi:hypothetical protein
MNIPQARVISGDAVEKFLIASRAWKYSTRYESKKHQLVLEDSDTWLAKIYLPWGMEWSDSLGIIEKPDSHYSLVLIRAGQAVVGHFHLGKLIDHKVFRAYMVRQKQGTSQIKHLKTKGKSRAGSRIRLAETERFFEEINERLTSYADQFSIDLWGISCAKTMWPYYFGAPVPPPFSPKQENLIELPVHIAQGSFEELVLLGDLLKKFHLILSEKGQKIWREIESASSENGVDEDW